MTTVPPSFLFARLRRRGIPARVSSLAMLFQRSPLLPLLAEARVISTSGFSEILGRSIMVVAGLGAYDSVTGASEITQLQPTEGSLTVNAVAGDPLNFIFQTTGTPHIPYGHTTSPLPQGLVLTGLLDSTVDSITGTPAQAGTYEVTVTAWELPVYTGDSFFRKFTFQIVNPPLPQIIQSPAGGNFPAGVTVSVSTAQEHGRTFTWKRDGAPLPVQEKAYFARSDARKFRAAPASDPGTAWRSGDAFVESADPASVSDPAWTAVAGGIGYDANGTIGGAFAPHFVAGTGNLQTLMFGSATPAKPSAIQLRMPFTISGPETLSFLTLRVQCDDGFVAWLNGTEIASLNKPDPLAWNSGASAEITGAAPVTFRDFDVSQYAGLLRQGGNLLAVQAMNRSPSSADFLFNCELDGGVNATNSPHLALTSLQPQVAGTYVLTVANPAGSVTSSPVPLLIVPSITTPPSSVTIEAGATAQLTVAADGSPPFSYQWYAGPAGDTLNPVQGAVQQTFTSPSLTASTAYWVRVASPAGTVDSPAATVTVNTGTGSYAEWKTALFSGEQSNDPAISGPAADPDGDGFTNEQEYVFGTQPLLPGTAFLPGIAMNGSQIEVTFTARKATGAGYAGRVRHYAVEISETLNAPWTPLPEAQDVIGNDQPVVVVLPQNVARRYCRLKVWLTP